MDSILSSVKIKYLGKVYRLIEQFDLISRIDLAKLSELAPTNITTLTRDLINANLVLERAAQTTIVRGRPAVGICVSPHYWQTLCAILMENEFEITLCQLNNQVIAKANFELVEQDFAQLGQVLLRHILEFTQTHEDKICHLLAVSIAIAGNIDVENHSFYLGNHHFTLDFNSLLEPHFSVPIIISEYFKDWVSMESHLGSAINSNNVLFLQLDDVINMSVLMNGQFLRTEQQIRMNINRVNLPRISDLSDKINLHFPDIERYQFQHQLTHNAIYQLVDLVFPNNQLPNNLRKIHFLCEKANQGEQSAVNILYHLADSLSYVLMNLVNIFLSEKIVISSSLLMAKEVFLSRLNHKLQQELLLDEHKVELTTSRYEWNSGIIANAAIKDCLYDGSLIGHILVSNT